MSTVLDACRQEPQAEIPSPAENFLPKFFRVALCNRRAGIARHVVWHGGIAHLQSWSMTSVAVLVVVQTWFQGWQSCCVDSICSKVIGTDSKKQTKSPNICPASEFGVRVGKCREQGQCLTGAALKKRCMNSNTDLKCNGVPSQRRFLSMNRNQSLWTRAISWQGCGVHPEDLPHGREGAHMNTSRSCWLTRTL